MFRWWNVLLSIVFAHLAEVLITIFTASNVTGHTSTLYSMYTLVAWALANFPYSMNQLSQKEYSSAKS